MEKERLEALKKDGWTERFLAGEPRLSEAIEAYREAGFDVHLEPLPKKSECDKRKAEDAEGPCRVCFEGFEENYRIIFTRPKATDS
ncbi:MAG: hypothetical protein V2J25_00230 [Desulfatiglans sp.]|jgi:hypothetical protein|nr:hypothetical protein [Thermodesulfobacteriota bacterium]MEE4351270.1 hypothetical protein [Desulfatiglans sp.]